jgi:hypothetical protein
LTCRRHAEQDADAGRDREAEEQHDRSIRTSPATVRSVGLSATSGLINHKARQHTGCSAEHRQDDAFGEQLRDDSSAGRAERDPHGNFLLTHRRTRHQQARHVAAGNHQQQPTAANNKSVVARTSATRSSRNRVTKLPSAWLSLG